MNKIITAATGITLALTVGCSTIAPNSSALPSTATTADRAAALKADVVLQLKNPAVQNGFKNALVLAGRQAMQRATSDADRVAIANQMWAAASAFNSLVTGTAISADQVSATVNSFTTGLDVAKYGDFINAANLAWSLVYPQLQSADDSGLWRTWMGILADAATQVASSYKTN